MAEIEEKQEKNPIKEVCEKFGITYDELSNQIGYSSDSLRNSASSGKLGEPMKKAIKLFEENRELQDKLQRINILSKLKDFDFERCSTKDLISINIVIENMQ